MWVNPTDNFIRKCDRQGCGHYGASRGNRSHTGVDYIATPEQPVKAIASGTVSYLGFPYSDDLSFRYVAIETDNGLVVRQLYVEPHVSVGMRVEAGDVIGTYQRLGIRYPGITEHVHIDIWSDNGTARPWSSGAMPINPTKLIPLPRPTPLLPEEPHTTVGANPNIQPTTTHRNTGFIVTSTALMLVVIGFLGMQLLQQGAFA